MLLSTNDPNPVPRAQSVPQQPIGVGFTAKQMKRKKPLNQGYLIDIEPLSDNQKRLFDSYNQEKNMWLKGSISLSKGFFEASKLSSKDFTSFSNSK